MGSESDLTPSSHGLSAAAAGWRRDVETPEGWKLVPIELTEDMAAAMECAFSTEAQWANALEVAPEPPSRLQPAAASEAMREPEGVDLPGGFGFIPTYGRISFTELGRDVNEARMGDRSDFDFGNIYPGHAMIDGLNFNSLNRIVSKYATSLSARSAGEAPISAEADWRTIETAPKGRKVIVSVPNGRNHKAKTLMARYWPKGTLEVAEGYENEDWAEEINGVSYMPGGWYEEFEGDDAPAHNIVPTHWRPIGPAPGEIAAVFTEAVNTSTTIPIVERLNEAHDYFMRRPTSDTPTLAEMTTREALDVAAKFSDAASVIQSLAGALEKCRHRFAEYAAYHAGKDAGLKAARNQDMVDLIDSALASLREGG